MQRYNPKEIEPKWQKEWEADGIYKAVEDSKKPKKYVLEYFPYPSGAAMHVGHVRNYTIGDAVARFARMNGYSVLHPMGWDAFGLPAENYAIKNNISPQRAIAENTAKFKKQLMQMGFSYDWSREINSSDPKYYKWTQWFFKLLFERGLAYQKESLQWWCDFDKTVLANEQVEAGKCWRCGNPVTKKALKQWFFKITDYADRLNDDLEKLDWSDAIKTMQRNWIGKSQGAEIDFAIENSDAKIKVFTTRPDTIFGATFMVLAPEHPLVPQITAEEQKQHVNSYIKAAEQKTDVERQETNREKTGVFTGAYAINPANSEKVPIWVADYVLYGYGTGAIMAVPAHDERDHEFAQKFDLPIVPVVTPSFNDNVDYRTEAIDRPTAVAVGYNPKTNKYCLLDWRPNPGVHGNSGLNWPGGGIDKGETVEQGAVREFAEETGYVDTKVERVIPAIVSVYYRDGAGTAKRAVKQIVELTVQSLRQEETYKDDYEVDAYTVVWLSRDEILARETSPINRSITEFVFGQTVHIGEGVMVNSGSYDNLPSDKAREEIVAELEKKGVGKAVTNYKIRDWLISRQRYWGAPIPIIHCEKDGAVPVPDDQLPVELPEVKSYAPTGEGTSVLASVSDWVNVTCPKCGGPAKRETDTMDGFACSSWYFLRFADPHNDKAPFDKDKVKFWLPVDDYIGGAEHAVMHLLYARMWTKVMHDAKLIDFDEPFLALRNQGMILAPDGRKMSKSWGNTITPDEIIEQGYGADAIRIMELFIGPWNQQANWSVEGMGGCYRFLNRVWNLTQEYLEADKTKPGQAPLPAVHRTIKKVTEDLMTMGFNTAIASLMELVNELYKAKASGLGGDDWQFTFESTIQLLAPFAPHISEELWHQLGHEESVHTSAWPKYDEKYLAQDTVTIVVQVNGKVRAELTMKQGASEDDIIMAAKAHEHVKLYLADEDIKKTVFVPGKLVSFVV